MTFGEFLLARIAEDERAANECAKVYPSPWESSDRGHCAYVTAGAPNFHHVVDLDQEQVACGTVEWLGDAVEHVSRHDPARVLAECKAKRRIVELHQAEDGQHPDFCGHDLRELPCPTLCLLALPYADHPDYRDEWRP